MVGTSLSDDSVDVADMKLDSPIILVLGNEGHGVRTNILRRCNQQVKIPSFGLLQDSDLSRTDVDSLNVSVTGGILLYHILSCKASNR